MLRKNIILDFMDPENKNLYGTYKDFSAKQHVKVLKKSLNLSVFLCDEYCIIPPRAALRCKYTRKALEESSYYLEKGLIRFPIREKSLEQLSVKKKNDYSQDVQAINNLEFDLSSSPEFINNYSNAIVRRETRVGQAVAEMVVATPFENPLWKKLVEKYSDDDKKLIQIQEAPKKLIQNNKDVSVDGIKKVLDFEIDKDDEFNIGSILQNKYFYIYIYEYDGRLIHGIPPKTTDFMIEHFGLAYEYSFWNYVLKQLKIYKCISKSDSKSICMMRDIPNCKKFVDSLMLLGEHAKKLSNVRIILSNLVNRLGDFCPGIAITPIGPFSEEAQLDDTATAYLSSLFYAVSEAIRIYLPEALETKTEEKESLADDRLRQVIESIDLKKCKKKKPYAFISYSSNEMKDTVYRDCVVLGEMGVNYWVDLENMVGTPKDSRGWKSTITKALKNCKLYIPYISQSFFTSDNCCEEVQTFIKKNNGAGIVLIIAKGFTIDKAIQQILTYNNILQRKVANSMIELFQMHANNASKNIVVDQPYILDNGEWFSCYYRESLLYNSFIEYKIIDAETYPNQTVWRNKAKESIETIKQKGDSNAKYVSS